MLDTLESPTLSETWQDIKDKPMQIWDLAKSTADLIAHPIDSFNTWKQDWIEQENEFNMATPEQKDYILGRKLGIWAFGLGTDGAGAKNLSIEEKFYSTSKLIGNHDLYNPGALDDLNASTFRGGRYKTYCLEEDTVLYRSGSSDEPLGQFFTFDKPVSELQTRIDKAILPKWPNQGASIIDTGYAVKLPKGSIVHVGDVAQQKDIFLGGTGQIFVEKPWLMPGVEIVDEFSLQEELLWNQIAIMK